MPPQEKIMFPFVVRDMLDFNRQVSFGLEVDVYASTNAEIFITGFTRAGSFRYTVAPTNDLAQSRHTFPLTDIPIFLAANTEGADGYNSQAYVKISLTINRDIMGVLAQGYVNIGKSISYPHGLNGGPLEGRGIFKQITGTNPAVNTEASVQPTTNSLLAPLSFAVTLVTDANVANRVVSLLISNGSSYVYRIPANAVQTAGTTVKYIWGKGLPSQNSAVGLTQINELPHDLILNDQCTFITETTNLQVGDDFGAPILYGEQFVDTN